jgi:hypothetical protein
MHVQDPSNITNNIWYSYFTLLHWFGPPHLVVVLYVHVPGQVIQVSTTKKSETDPSTAAW